MPLIVADAVSVSIDGAALLPPTSLTVDAGECVAVRGPNGAGKTTLLRVLAGRIRPNSGAVAMRGEPLDERRRAVRREIAPLIEPPALYPDLTLAEQLALIEAAWSGEPVPDRSPSAEAAPVPGMPRGLGAQALDAFGIEHLADRFPNELSSGQRQLLSLAVAFARPAALLILDEPEQRLDPERRELVGRAILDARERGTAIVFASHDAALVGRVADRQLRVGE